MDWVNSAADCNPNVGKAGLIKPGTNFTDEFRSDPSALGRCVEAYCPQTLPESTGNAKALFCFVLERVDKSDSFDLGIDVWSNARIACTVSSIHRMRACGIVPEGTIAVRATPAGGAHPVHATTTAAYSRRAEASRWTCQAPT